MIELTDIKETVATVLRSIPGVDVVNTYGYFPDTQAASVCVIMPPFRLQSNYGFIQPGSTEPDWQSHRFFVEFWVKDTGDPVVVDQTMTALNTAAATTLLANQLMTVGADQIRLGWYDGGSALDFRFEWEVYPEMMPPMQDGNAYLVATMTIPVTTVI